MVGQDDRGLATINNIWGLQNFMWLFRESNNSKYFRTCTQYYEMNF